MHAATEKISWTEDTELLSETGTSLAWLDSTAAEAATQAATELMATLMVDRDHDDQKDFDEATESVLSEWAWMGK